MKITLCLTFILLIFVTLAFVANSFAQATTPRNMVRVVYFVPRGRMPQRDINAKLNTLIKGVQTFFADEMERHGFGRKTFAFETDTEGNAVVHRVNGRFVDTHYHKGTRDKVIGEVALQFDPTTNVYFVVADVSTETIEDACGIGFHMWNGAGDLGGNAIIPASGHCFEGNFGLMLTAHELGHAFGLLHDFSNDTYIMSYGSVRTELAPCTAEWLDANRYFNSRQRPPNNGRTAIRMLPVAVSPPYGIRFQFAVSDPDGLQISHLLAPATDWNEGPGDLKMIGCKTLTGVSQTVEFVTTELTVQSKLIRLRIVDGTGNWTETEHASNVSAVFPSKVVSIPDANLASAIREALGLTGKRQITQLDMLGLRELNAAEKQITDLSGLEHARNLKYLYLWNNQITDITVLEKLPSLTRVNLAFNQIHDITAIRGLTNLVSLDLSKNPCDDVSPVAKLTQLQSLFLFGYQIQDLSLFAELTQLRHLNLIDNQISDITPLAALTRLEGLWLGGNRISDVSPLAGLTQLKRLYLWNNRIRDILSLTGLTELVDLGLSGNQISDITPIAALTRLEGLWLGGNHISDVSPLTGLVTLNRLNLAANSILNTSMLHTLLERNPDLELDIDVAGNTPVVRFVAPKPHPMYWIDTEHNTLHRLIDNKVENLAPSVQNATDFAVNAANGKLYWTEKTSNTTGRIRRANLDGTNVQLVKDLTSVPLDIAVDTVGGKLYLANAWGKIQRLNFDGTGLAPNLITDLESPMDLALDGTGGKLYWIENTSSIRRANLDGSEVETLAADLGTPKGITVIGNKIYWTERVGRGIGKVQRADLNGENIETVVTVPGAPRGIAVDTAKRKIYWTNAVGGIQQADTNGNNIQNLVTELTAPGDFAIYIRATRIFVTASQRTPMYWVGAEVGTLHRLTGTTVENIAPSVQNATSLAVDAANAKLYWAEKTSRRIRRANLNGTNVELVKELTSVPHGIALDITGRKLYLTNVWGKVQRLNFDGTNFEPNLITGLDSPQNLVLDVASSKVYWTENSGRIRRANLDGSNIQTIATKLGTLGGIAIASGKVYWTEKTDENGGKIQRANLDGTNSETLATLTDVPFGIAVNIAERKLYWANATGEIRRANLNGSNIENLVTGLSVTPVTIALGTAATGTTIAAAPTTVGVIPDETLLHPNYPNPFNPETWIPYQLFKSADVTLTIYAVNGQMVRRLALGYQAAGMYQSRSRAAYWDGRNEFGEPVASGLYFYTLAAGDFSATRKMLIRK